MPDIPLQDIPVDASPQLTDVIAGDNGVATSLFTLSAIATLFAAAPLTLTNHTINGADNTLTVRIANDVSGLGANVATFLTTPSSANLRAAMVDETGNGSLLFQNGDLGTPSAVVLTNGTGLPLATGVSGQLSLANGGTGANLADPNADRILFWDDSAGAVTWLTVGSGLSITGTTLSATSTAPAWGDITGTLSNQTDLQAALDNKVDALAPVAIAASTNLTRASHGNRLLICNSGSAINLTIEDDTTGAWDDGDFFAVLNVGAGTVTIQGDGTSTVTAVPGFALTIPQNGIGGGQRSGANAWSAYGQFAVQAQATWEAGAGTTESVISPAKLAAAIAALAPAGGATTPYADARTWGVLVNHGGNGHIYLPTGTVTTLGTGTGVTTPFNTDQGWPRVSYATAGAANSDAGLRCGANGVDYMPGADARSTPLTFRGAFAAGDAETGCRMFLGLRAGTTAPGATEPSAFVSCFGVGADSDMTQLVFMHNDASGVCTEVVLNGGTGFPCNSNGVDRYELEMAATGEGGVQTVHWIVRNLSSGVEASGTATTNLPAAGTLMNVLADRNSAANAAVVTLLVGDISGGNLARVTVGA